MNASRFALIALVLGVVLLGLLPTAGVPPPTEREPAFSRAGLPFSGHGPAKEQRDEDALALERWAAIKGRLLDGTSDVSEDEKADTAPGSPTVAGADPAANPVPSPASAWPAAAHGENTCAEEDEEDAATGPLRRAELKLLRVLAPEGVRSDETNAEARGTLRPPPLEEPATLVSWSGPMDSPPPPSGAVRPTAAYVPCPASTEFRGGGIRGRDAQACGSCRRCDAWTLPEPALLRWCRASKATSSSSPWD